MMTKTCASGSAASAFAGRRGIRDIAVAGKTGTLSRDEAPYMQYSWFVGFAPADKPSIVVAVMIEFGGHGTRAAQIASKIIAAYLHVTPIVDITVDG